MDKSYQLELPSMVHTDLTMASGYIDPSTLSSQPLSCWDRMIAERIPVAQVETPLA